MIHNASFRRKVIYLGLIALLLIPLYVVGHPAVGDPSDRSDSQSSPGGRLAQLRSQYDLSPAQLGEIDPTSESMKLATLGMRGIAANILWTKANEYKKKENWEGLVAVVNQMARLQPNFISVWEFQSHNLSYNISVEQDDYRFRYLWVKKGIEFLIQGTKYNRKEPKLFWTLGWYTGQKFGRADENKQFRRMYRVDHDFHDLQSPYVDIFGEAGGPDGKPDTWMTSRLWFLRAYNLVDTQGSSLRGKAPHIFYADAPKARMNYSSTIEEEGYLDEKAEVSWQKAGVEWFALGNRTVPTSWGVNIRLNDREKMLDDAKQQIAKLEELVPGLRETIRQERIAALPPKERESLDIPDEKLDENSYQVRLAARAKTDVTHMDVAKRAPREIQAKAFRTAQQATEAETVADYIDRYRQNVAFEYWRTRCQVEQLHNTVEARKHMFAAQQLMDKVEYTAARAEFEKAWDLWATIMEEHPGLLDQLTADDLLDYVKKYAGLLNQLESRIPPDFKLRPLIENKFGIPPELQGLFEPGPETKTEKPPTTEDSKVTPPKSDTDKSEPKTESKTEAKTESKAEPKTDSKTDTKKETEKTDSGTPAKSEPDEKKEPSSPEPSTPEKKP
jgi:hypothetical protein